MWIRRYRAPDMPSALKRIRSDLGPEAIILESRQVRAGGLMRFLRPPLVEVLAAMETSQAGSQRVGSPAPPAERADRRDSSESQATLDRLARELDSLRANVRLLEQGVSGQDDLGPNLRFELLRDWLSGQLMDSSFSAELCAAARARAGASASSEAIQDAVLACLEERIPTTGPLELSASGPTVLCLAGPTGIGKTTTLAKLAAVAVKAGERVALVTMDTFRVGAAAQIGTYAEIMGMPLEVAYSPEELRNRVDSHRDRDLVLVDTPGCSHLNTVQMEELRAFLRAVPECSVHLAVAASTDYKEMLRVVDAFRILPLATLVMTKLDETTCYGPALSLLRQSGLPASYVTNGQRVPEDLATASASDLARLLINGRSSPLDGPSDSQVEERTPVSGHQGRPEANGRHDHTGAWRPVAHRQGAAI